MLLTQDARSLPSLVAFTKQVLFPHVFQNFLQDTGGMVLLQSGGDPLSFRQLLSLCSPAFWTLYTPRRMARSELYAAFSEKLGPGCTTQRLSQGAQRSCQLSTPRAPHLPTQCGYSVAPDTSLSHQHQQTLIV